MYNFIPFPMFMVKGFLLIFLLAIVSGVDFISWGRKQQEER